MSGDLTTFYAQQYATNIAFLAQQKENRLAKAVTIGSYRGKAASPTEQVGSVSATKRTERYDPVSFSTTPTNRAWVYPVDYDWYDAIDNIDKLRMIIDPTSSYAQNAIFAMNRAKDDEIIGAFFGSRNSGETGATSVTFPSGQQVAATTGASGATGLNVAKLRAAKKLLMAADIDLDSEEIWCAISAAQHDNLLNEVQVVSTDFNDRPVLVDGKVNRFLGINFIHTERLPVDGSGYRRNPVWIKSGMHLGVWEDIKTAVTVREDLRGRPYQVGVMGTFGATRLEEVKVVEIKSSES